jgi:acyl dehydratase
MMKFMENPYFPEIEIHTVLHGEEKLYMVHKRIEVGAKYRVRNEVVDIIDRGDKKGTFIINRMNSYLVNEKGEEDLAYYIDRVTFCRSIGGTGFKGTGKSKVIPNWPKRAPDHVFKDKTFINQAMLYRLNSDPNPLHVDANMAALARFERPIIHGISLNIQVLPLPAQSVEISYRTC